MMIWIPKMKPYIVFFFFFLIFGRQGEQPYSPIDTTNPWVQYSLMFFFILNQSFSLISYSTKILIQIKGSQLRHKLLCAKL